MEPLGIALGGGDDQERPLRRRLHQAGKHDGLGGCRHGQGRSIDTDDPVDLRIPDEPPTEPDERPRLSHGH